MAVEKQSWADNTHKVQGADDPKVVRQEMHEAQQSMATLDVQELGWSVQQARQWIALFHENEPKNSIVSVAVFADDFSDEEKKELRSVGAVLFERSLPSNADTQTADALIAHYDAQQQMREVLSSSGKPEVLPVQGTFDPVRDSWVNEYPAPMTREKLSHILDVLNKEE